MNVESRESFDPVTDASLSSGAEYTCGAGVFRVPVPYRCVTTSIMVCAVALDLVQALLPTGVKAQLVGADRGGLVFYLMDAEASGFGAYQEVAIGVLCRRGVRGSRADHGDADWYPPPIFFSWFAVGDELPTAAGLELWGFPKVCADVDIDAKSDSASCAVRSADAPSMALKVQLADKLEPRRLALRCLTWKAGTLAETLVCGPGQFGEREAPEYELTSSPKHPLSNVLKAVPTEGRALSSIVVRQQSYSLDLPWKGGGPRA